MTRGYYSIIQYCPDPARLEAVNIGVALFCPDVPFLRARFGKRKTPVQQLFGKQDWEFVEAQQAELEAHLGHHEEFRNLEDFQGFVARRANAFRLTPPRWTKVADPEEELRALLDRMVGAQGQAATASGKRVSIELKARLLEAGLGDRLKANVEVRPPSLPKPFKVPFAFRNGRMNLIEPVQFEGHSPSAAFKTASVHAVQGEFLADYEDPSFGRLGLIVVGKFSPEQDDARRTALSVFEKHRVQMHTFETLEPLIEEIRLHAHG